MANTAETKWRALIAPLAEDFCGMGAMQRRGRLGGLRIFYRRKAG